MSSRLTGVFSGAPSSFQLGNSSSRARGSNTAPDRMWAPTSEPFSTTLTLISWPASAACCLMRQAADRPAGPAPTMTTSNSMNSRSTVISPESLGRIENCFIFCDSYYMGAHYSNHAPSHQCKDVKSRSYQLDFRPMLLTDFLHVGMIGRFHSNAFCSLNDCMLPLGHV